MSFQLIAELSELAQQYPDHSEDIKNLMVKVLNKTDGEEGSGQGAKLGPKPLEPAGTGCSVGSGILGTGFKKR